MRCIRLLPSAFALCVLTQSIWAADAGHKDDAGSNKDTPLVIVRSILSKYPETPDIAGGCWYTSPRCLVRERTPRSRRVKNLLTFQQAASAYPPRTGDTRGYVYQ